MNKKGLKRNTIDKFYTKPEIVNNFNNLIKSKLKIDKKNDLIIEPSAGEGAFINIIKELCKNYLFYDIKPENDESDENNKIVTQDYLTLEYKKLCLNKYNKIHIIGNPPFGRQSSLAFKFIKISSNFCNSISFILPKSFKKDSFKNKIPLYFHLIHEEDITENNAFLLNGEEYNVPCIYQIWEKKETKRIIKEKEKIKKGYKFVKKEDKPSISFRRVGVNAGNISKDCNDKSPQSHYFIEIEDDLFNDELFEKLEKLKFNSSENTVGPKSISKPELIKEFNSLF